MLSYLTLHLVMPIWCNARVRLMKLLGTTLFFLSCFFLHASCSFLHAPSTTSNDTHGRTLTGPTLTDVNIHGQTADTHRLGSASPNPCPCIHDIAGAQQRHGIGLGSTQIRDKYLCVCVCVCVCVCARGGGGGGRGNHHPPQQKTHPQGVGR